MRLRTLSEAECYARCYGARGGEQVTVVRVVARDRGAGEHVRALFEQRLEARTRDRDAEAA